ncbi:hypothetical protein VCRA2113O140_100092 [Vibrio crassostreae]|nr:hypothetical protein VCRA2113O140_100092 [Vibrio crassostreae]CAK2572777.1 hypothetical protein VCRA2121O154_100092 [Vibrio crassostreae]CAK2631693.1 hypothetical protein VCRA2119O149_1420005 [Vibrio crassostreae]CAK3078491.1 hypothetical protein VCRA2121O156_100092 [Vibrio crassostreae]CAK3149052.1 hypothetical protein VCRA2121O152_100092 [Vibrio crassostreae]
MAPSHEKTPQRLSKNQNVGSPTQQMAGFSCDRPHKILVVNDSLFLFYFGVLIANDYQNAAVS